MVRFWSRFRNRHEMTEQAIQQPTTSALSLATASSIREQQRDYQITKEVSALLERYLEERMIRTEFDYFNEKDSEEEPCTCCTFRKGKFIAECQEVLCRYCCYAMLLNTIKDHKGGPLTSSCPKCNASLKNLIRRKRCSVSDNCQDENNPNTGYIEQSFTISEFIESMCGDGCLNRGFESSSS